MAARASSKSLRNLAAKCEPQLLVLQTRIQWRDVIRLLQMQSKPCSLELTHPPNSGLMLQSNPTAPCKSLLGRRKTGLDLELLDAESGLGLQLREQPNSKPMLGRVHSQDIPP